MLSCCIPKQSLHEKRKQRQCFAKTKLRKGLLVDSGVQRRAGRDVALQNHDVAALLRRHGVHVVQAPETVVVLVAVALLSAATPPPGLPEAPHGAPAALLVLDVGAVKDVDGVGRQGELQAAQVLVHHLFAVDELAAVHLGGQRRKE